MGLTYVSVAHWSSERQSELLVSISFTQGNLQDDFPVRFPTRKARREVGVSLYKALGGGRQQ